MRHLTQSILDNVQHNKKLAAYLKHLDQFGVVGVTGSIEYKLVLDYLKHRLQEPVDIRYSEAKGLIWVTTVGEILDRQFSGLYGTTKPFVTNYPQLGWSRNR